MIRRFAAGLVALIYSLAYVLAVPPPAVAAEPPRVTAAAAVLIDMTTGRILYERNAHEERHPASTTKIMTAILALEMGNLGDEVRISTDAAYTPGSTMYLKPGDRYPLAELLEGLLLVSGNDAAAAIAEHIGGTVEGFAAMMTARARTLGLDHSRFRNPHGLTEPGHYSSAHDLAMMARHALTLPRFAELVCRGNAEACGTSASGETIAQPLFTTNRLLFSYQWADGVKTGTTSAAGHCLVASATRLGQRLIAVVLDSLDRYGDTVRLLDYGFENFALRNPAPAGETVFLAPVRGGVRPVVPVSAARDTFVVVPRRDLDRIRTVISVNPDLRAPVVRGERVGTLAVVSDGTLFARVPLVAAEDLPRAGLIRRLLGL